MKREKHSSNVPAPEKDCSKCSLLNPGLPAPYLACFVLWLLFLAGVTTSAGAANRQQQPSATDPDTGEATQPKAGTLQPARAAKPNIILITIDTVRADHLGCYGAQNVKTPTLDSLARDGVVFERAIAQVPLTWPSHAVILTGTYPFQNGAQDFTRPSLNPQVRSVAQAFQRAGYATGAVVSSFVLDRSWRLNRGFDFYDDKLSTAKLQKTDSGGSVARRAGESVANAIAWLKKTSPRPFFLWLHLYDPHRPYNPPDPYHTEYKDHLYDGEIAYTDHELGALISWLKERHLYDPALILMLSDHGESLGEHGEAEHGFFLYNSTVHVPLILKLPAGSGIAPGRKSEVVETAAVAPTLLQLAGIEDPMQKEFQAPPLLSANRGKNNAPAYSETTYPFSLFGWSPLHGLENEHYHFIEAPKPELYDLATDAGEARNLANEKPAVVAVMREQLQKLLRRSPLQPPSGTGALSPEAQEKLRALGYFGFHASVSPEALKHGLADPKDKIWEFSSIMKSEDAFQQKHGAEGEALLLQVQEKDPNISMVAFLLGELALKQRNWERAAQQLHRCLELNPEFDSAMTALARALFPLGHADEARSWLKKALKINSQNYTAWYLLGLFETADSPASLADYEKALAIQPTFLPAQRELGTALYHRKDYAAAAAHLEKAVALGWDDPDIHNALGDCYAKTQRLDKAVKEHQRVTALAPNLAEGHLNLARDYQKLGKPQAAKTEYDQACRLNAQFCQGTQSRQR